MEDALQLVPYVLVLIESSVSRALKSGVDSREGFREDTDPTLYNEFHIIWLRLVGIRIYGSGTGLGVWIIRSFSSRTQRIRIRIPCYNSFETQKPTNNESPSLGPETIAWPPFMHIRQSAWLPSFARVVAWMMLSGLTDGLENLRNSSMLFGLRESTNAFDSNPTATEEGG